MPAPTTTAVTLHAALLEVPATLRSMPCSLRGSGRADAQAHHAVPFAEWVADVRTGRGHGKAECSATRSSEAPSVRRGGPPTGALRARTPVPDTPRRGCAHVRNPL